MTSDVKIPDPLRDVVRAGAREASTVWWWFLALGAMWIWFGAFVLSYKVGSLVAVATFVGAAFLFGGITELVVASRVPTMRWLSIVAGSWGSPPASAPSSGRTSRSTPCRSWLPGT